MRSVIVVGGGISGLVAAWHLKTSRPDVEVTIAEASDRVGGKLRQAEIAGHQVDVGAESALWRRPEVVSLLEELGISAVHPVRYPAMLYSRGHLEKLPSGTLMGIPSDPESARGLLSEDEVTRASNERPVHLEGADITVGEAVEQALGSAVVDRMVEPLLGGVYAGQARQLSAKACLPALYDALTSGTPLTQAAAKASSAVSSTDTREVFGAPADGMGSLPDKLRAALEERGVRVLTNARVTELRRSLGHRQSWHVEIDVEGLPEPHETDAVLFATPATATSQLLGSIAPDAAATLREVQYASMALVTYAFATESLPEFPAGTGFLVPATDGRSIKASTFSSVKWPWLAQAAPEVRYVRVSFGRFGETDILQRSDDDLVALGLTDLADALGVELPHPLDTHVQRWDDGLPQYTIGHVERMTTVREQVAALPGLAVAGAQYGGVGIPACVLTARAAAAQLLDDSPA